MPQLILCLPNLAAVPTQSPLPPIVFFANIALTVSIHAQNLASYMSSNPTYCATQSPTYTLSTVLMYSTNI